MGQLASALAGKLAALDTAVFIYYLEENPDYVSIADEVFEAIDRRETHGMTSVLTLLEMMVKPLREGQGDVADSYRDILANAANISLHPMSEAVAVRAAQLRGKYAWLRTPDAIQLATALEYGAGVVVTNDESWRRISEVPVLILKDYLPAAT